MDDPTLLPGTRMMESTKRAIQKVLGRFGYQLSRTASPYADAFGLQRELIANDEPVILDIGAHVGTIAKIYREWFPLASIHCFEPFPRSFRALSTGLERDPRTFCHETAVSDENGTAVLHVNLSSATNSLLATDERGASFWGEGVLDTESRVEVGTLTVDTFCREAAISHIDILKMDVQGAEFSVLKGAKGQLADQRISLIYSELILCPTYEAQHEFHEYLAFLDSFGYEFIDFFNEVRKGGRLIQADVIFVSSSLAQEIENRAKSA